MRIITGSAKGCKLKTPKTQNTRPTADRIKESIFNIIAARIFDKGVLDLFAGTGNLGLEALSRGAAFAVFVDQSAESIQLIRENAAHTRLDTKSEILKKDVFSVLEHFQRVQKKFSLVFCDPPYNKEFCQRVLPFLDQADILADDALVVIEHAREDALALELKNLQLVRNQTYGSTTQVSFFQWMTLSSKEDTE